MFFHDRFAINNNLKRGQCHDNFDYTSFCAALSSSFAVKMQDVIRREAVPLFVHITMGYTFGFFMSYKCTQLTRLVLSVVGLPFPQMQLRM